MTKKIVFSRDSSDLSEAHAAGGCLLPENISWPTDIKKKPLLHLATFPAFWVFPENKKWFSIFTPYYIEDTYLHWENLTASDENHSVILIHNNNGPKRNEYTKKTTQPKRILLSDTALKDSEKNFESKIFGIPAWIQDEEKSPNHSCLAAINGNDIDIAFPEEPGIFSDGLIYLFFRNNSNNSHSTKQGFITFQFS